MNDDTMISQFLKAKDINYPLQTIDDLSLRDALYLITLIRSSTVISSEACVGPFTSVPPLFPDMRPDNDGIGINHLVNRKLITLNQFAFKDENRELNGIHIHNTKWKVHLEDFEEAVLQIYEYIARKLWPAKWLYDIKDVWLEMAVLEC